MTATPIAIGPKQGTSPTIIQPKVPLPGNRPIDASTLNVRENLSPTELRPVVSTDLKVANTFHASGDRPVAASQLRFDHTLSVMGSRPIASNEIDGPDLMGYLD